MQVERVRRVNEPCEETALRVVVECVQCGYVIEAGGISLGQRWLHLSCVEDYIMMLERARDRALVDNDALRAAVQAQSERFVWGSGGSAGVPAGWVQVPYSGGGGGGVNIGTNILYTVTSTAAVAPNVYDWTVASTTLYTGKPLTTTSSGLFDTS